MNKKQRIIIQYQDSLRSMTNWLLRPDSRNLADLGCHNISLIANHLALSAQHFLPNNFETKKIVTKINKFNPKKYYDIDCKYFSHILEMKDFVNSEMKDLVSNFIIHGSMATLDYAKGWSDVDTLVVVPHATLKNTKKLLRLRELSYEAHKFLYRIDPLQHHGLIFITEFDINAYPSCYLPIEVLEKSVSLIDGNENITLNVRNSQKECIDLTLAKIKIIKKAKKEGILKHHAYKGEYLLENYENTSNGMYQMKYYLGLYAILPSLILCSLGNPCYKGDSFKIAKNLFSKEAWQIIETVSKIRSMWPSLENYPYVGNKIPDWLKKELGTNYFSIGGKFLKEAELLLLDKKNEKQQSIS